MQNSKSTRSQQGLILALVLSSLSRLHSSNKLLAIFSLMVFSAFPSALTGQSCNCNAPSVPKVGSGVGVSTVSQAVGLGLLLPWPNSTYTAQTVCVKGDLTVDIDYHFILSNISMDKDASMIVNSSKTLTIESCDVRGCEQMWDDITINASAKLVMTSTIIRDAEYAVYAKAGSTLTIIGNQFKNNHIGIYAVKKTSGTIITFANTNITGNIFKTEGTLAAPRLGEIGYAGIELISVTGFNVGNANQNSTPNEFERLDNGVIATRSNLGIYNCDFSRIIISSQTAADFNKGNAVSLKDKSTLVQKDCNIGDCTVGLLSLNSDFDFQFNTIQDTCIVGVMALSGKIGKMTINQNSITAQGAGIFLQALLDNTDLEIIGNTIDLSNDLGMITPNTISGGIAVNIAKFNGSDPAIIAGNTVYLYNRIYGIGTNTTEWVNIISNTVFFEGYTSAWDGAFGYGLALQVAQGSLVQDNKIYGHNDGFSFDIPEVYAGILSFNSNNVDFCCNLTTETEIGVNFFGDVNSDINLRQTGLGNHRVGLLMSDATMIGDQLQAGNLWNGSFIDFGAEHKSNDLFVIYSSEFKVHSFGVPITPLYPQGISPNPQSTGINWFSLGSGSPQNCTQYPDCGIIELTEDPGLEGDSIAIQVASGGFSIDSPFKETMNWGNRRVLYKRLVEHPELLTGNALMQAFLNGQQGTTVSAFTGLWHGVEASFQSPATEVGQLKTNAGTVHAKLLELKEIDEDLWANPGSATLAAQKQAILDQLDSLFAESELLLQAIDTHRGPVLQGLIAENAQITATAIYEVNEKQVADVYLNTIAQGGTGMTAQQVGILEDIAEQCPRMGGNAVLMARGLLRINGNTTLYNDQDICETSPLPPLIGETPLTGQAPVAAHVSPNPANKNITVRTSEELPNGRLQLLNQFGQVVYVMENLPGTKFTLAVDGLHTGLYLVQISDGKTNVFTEKLIISR